MPGFVNYFYHEGTLPQHTKSFFNEHEILTVHGIIVKNSLILLHKIKYFPQSVPKNICDTFPADIPTVDSDFTTASTWREYYIYSSTSRHFKMSVFYKGPLLAIYAANANVTTLPSLFSINIYSYVRLTQNVCYWINNIIITRMNGHLFYFIIHRA